MRLHVLVVDDSSLMRILVSEAVRASHVPIADVVAVCDGAEALEALHTRLVNILLTDLQMPKVDGTELVARIARTPALNRVHVVTLSSDVSNLPRFRAAGSRVRAHLDKPVRFDCVNQVLTEIWEEVKVEGR